MTITNDERREVAARLRKKHFERQGTFEPQCIEVQERNRMHDLLECLPERRNMFLVLADLIEPELERMCRNEATGSDFKCSECGCSVTGSAYWTEANICNGDWNFCPNCDACVKEDA